MAPATEAVILVELPWQIVAGEAAGEGSGGNGFTVIVVLPQFADQHPDVLYARA